jgi:hypothetical protein
VRAGRHKPLSALGLHVRMNCRVGCIDLCMCTHGGQGAPRGRASPPAEASLSLWPRRGPHACSPVPGANTPANPQTVASATEHRADLHAHAEGREWGQSGSQHLSHSAAGHDCRLPVWPLLKLTPATRPKNWTGNGSCSDTN